MTNDEGNSKFEVRIRDGHPVICERLDTCHYYRELRLCPKLCGKQSPTNNEFVRCNGHSDFGFDSSVVIRISSFCRSVSSSADRATGVPSNGRRPSQSVSPDD